MRGPKPPMIELDVVQQQELEALLRRHSTAQQVALRARIVLAAAAGLNNGQICRQLAVSRVMVRLWRQRWLDFAAVPLDELSLDERLAAGPRPGRSPTITAEQLCRIVALACEPPTDSNRPISQWSGREIAEEILARNIVPRISARHAARLLKGGP